MRFFESNPSLSVHFFPMTLLHMLALKVCAGFHIHVHLSNFKDFHNYIAASDITEIMPVTLFFFCSISRAIIIISRVTIII